MPSPFPGMDPYLEAPDYWPGFHVQLVTSLGQLITSGNVDRSSWPRFQAQLVTSLEQIPKPGLLNRYCTRLQNRHYSLGGEAHEEPYLEVWQRGDENVITLIDVVSPTNRTTCEGRDAYHHT